MVAVLNPAKAVLDDIPEVKQEDAQFNLLTQVNPFVVDQRSAGIGLPYQDKRKQRHAVGTQGWNTNNESMVCCQG